MVQMAKKYSNPSKTPEKEMIKIEVTDKSKEDRTKIHHVVKSTFKHLVIIYSYYIEKINFRFWLNCGVVQIFT